MPLGTVAAGGAFSSAAGSQALAGATKIRHSKFGRSSGGGGRSPKRKRITLSIVSILLVLLLIIGGYLSILRGLSGLIDDDAMAGSYVVVTLYAQVNDSTDKPIPDVILDLNAVDKDSDKDKSNDKTQKNSLKQNQAQNTQTKESASKDKGNNKSKDKDKDKDKDNDKDKDSDDDDDGTDPDPYTEILLPKTDESGATNKVIQTSGGIFGGPVSGKTQYFSASTYCDVGLTECGAHTEVGVCAADPYIIPHGSVIYVQEVDSKTLKPTGKVYGYAEATDTGGFLTDSHTNSLAAQGPAYNGYRKGIYDKWGKNVYKRCVDLWYPSNEVGAWGTRLCAVTIVKATTPGCRNPYYCGPGGAHGCEAQGATLANLQQFRTGGITTDDTGAPDINISFGSYTITASGGLTVNPEDVDPIDVGELVDNAGSRTTVTVPGGSITFWATVTTEDGSSGGASNMCTPYTKPDAYTNGNEYPGPYNCTYFAWGRVQEVYGKRLPNHWGNAGKWYQSAQKAGYKTYPAGTEPKPGWLIIFSEGINGGYGHVAMVEYHKNGKIHVSESGAHSHDPGKKWRYHDYPDNYKYIRGYIVP